MTLWKRSAERHGFGAIGLGYRTVDTRLIPIRSYSPESLQVRPLSTPPATGKPPRFSLNALTSRARVCKCLAFLILGLFTAAHRGGVVLLREGRSARCRRHTPHFERHGNGEFGDRLIVGYHLAARSFHACDAVHE